MEDLGQLGRGLQTIATTTKDAKTKNILAYFVYEKARIGEILNRRPDRKSLEEILEMSESFVEGAEAIARHHTYDFAYEEKMYLRTRSLIQKLEEILKYYIASRMFPDDPELAKKMKRSLEDFRATMEQLNSYAYRDRDVEKVRKRLNAVWEKASVYLEKGRESDLPLVMDLAAVRIETLLDQIGIYHSKNQ
jgi:hypothetical protein